jgi:hypothetical protein
MEESEMSAESDVMLVRYSIADAAIAEMRSTYMGLVQGDARDKNAFAVIHQARMDVKTKRCAIETERKALKAKALEYGRAVDGEAKRLTVLLEPIEAHLEAQEAVYTQEQERQKEERDRAAAKRLQDRVDRMQAVNGKVDLIALKAMSDSEFDAALDAARKAFEEAEEERKAKDEARAYLEEQRQAELKKLAEDRKAAEAERLAAEKVKSDAERAVREAEEARRLAEAAVQAEKEKAVAVERARLEEQERARREADAKEQRAKEEDERKADERRIADEQDMREKALAPARKKIRALADAIRGAAVDALSGQPTSAEEEVMIHRAMDLINQVVSELSLLSV